MLRLGYEAEAREMVARLVPMVEREGLREYYDPLTGEGLGAREFAWSSLILEMAEPGRGRRSQLSAAGRLSQ